MTNKAIELIKNLLTYNPEKRLTAKQALAADYFFEKPVVKKAHELSMKLGLDSVHELEIRKKHMSMRAAISGGRPKPPT
jgi:cyclin-dependent kinase 12/13